MTANFRQIQNSPGANTQDTSSPAYMAMMNAWNAVLAAEPAFLAAQSAWEEAGSPNVGDPNDNGAAEAYLAVAIPYEALEQAYSAAQYNYQVYNGLATD